MRTRTTDVTKTRASKNRISEPELAKRFAMACDHNDVVPAPHFGRLAYITGQLKELHGIVVSPETVRKWFAGEARPRPDKMKALATLLRVSESWLSLGSKFEPSPEEMRQHSRSAEGAVNLVAGMFGINGANYAFPEEDDPRADHVHFYAIIKGRHNAIYVSRAVPRKGGFKFNVSNKFETLLTIGVVPRSPTQFDFYQITPSAISKFGTKKGALVELNVSESGRDLVVKSEKLPRIEDIESLRREPISA